MQNVGIKFNQMPYQLVILVQHSHVKCTACLQEGLRIDYNAAPSAVV